MKINKSYLYLILSLNICPLSSPLFCSEQETDFETKKPISLPFQSSIDKLLFTSPNSATSDVPQKKPVIKTDLTIDSYCFNTFGEVVKKDFVRPSTPPPTQEDVESYLSFHQPFQPSSRGTSYCSNQLLKGKNKKYNPFSIVPPHSETSFETISLTASVLSTSTVFSEGRSLLEKVGTLSLANPKP